MKSFRDQLRRTSASELVRSAGAMSGATAVAQALTLLSMPWLTRLYGPSAFGIYAIWYAVMMAVSSIGSGRYELAAVLPDGDRDAAKVVILSLGVLSASVGLTAVISLGGYLSTRGLSIPGGLSLFVLAPIAIAVMGITQSLSYWYMRMKAFTGLGALRVIQAAVLAAASVVAGYVAPNAGGLALGWTLGQAASALVAAVAVGGRIVTSAGGVGTSEMRRLAVAYKDFPLSNAPHALVDGLRETGFVALFTAGFGPGAAGQYSVSARAARTPANFLGQSLSQVVYRRFSDLHRSADDLAGRIGRGMLALTAIGTPAALAVGIFAPQIFAWLFGAEWRTAGVYTAIMAPALLTSFAISPFTYVPAITGNLRTALRLTLADLALRGVALVVGYALGSPLAAIVALSVTWTAMSVLTGVFYVRMAAGTERTAGGQMSDVTPIVALTEVDGLLTSRERHE